MTDIFPVGSRVCAYARDSGGRNQELSVIQQREKIGEFCIENGLILSRIYEDIAHSGSSVVGRAQFLEMVDYLGNDVPERGLILWEFARLSRDYDDLMYYVSDLKRQGYIIHSISDSVPEGLEGSLLLGVRAYANAKFLQDLRRNIRRGLHYVVRTHGAHIGTVPVGYLKENLTIGTRRDGSPHIISRLVIDEVTAPFVRQAFEMRAMGSTYQEIHNTLHLYGWHLSYKRLFANMVYTGTKVFGGEVIEDYCQPIISNDTWRAVQRIQADRKARNGYNHPRALRSRFWLTGILYCARCGKPMHGHTIHKKGEKPYNYYICTSKVTFEPCGSMPIRKDKLETLVMEVLRRIIYNPCILSNIYERSQAQKSTVNQISDAVRMVITNKIANNEKQINRILTAIKDVGHSHAMLIELNSLEEQQAELQKQLARTEVVPTVVPLSLDDITANIQQALDISSDQDRAIIVRGFISRIMVGKVNGAITGKMMLSLGNGETVINL